MQSIESTQRAFNVLAKDDMTGIEIALLTLIVDLQQKVANLEMQVMAMAMRG